MSTGRLVYLDTETTGLDPARHEVWELAYAVDDDPVMSGVLLHSRRNADPTSLAMNGYWDAPTPSRDDTSFEVVARAALQGATLVGSNPAFDSAFLRARWGVTPWHYRMLDVESYAMPVFGWDTPRGLSSIVAELARRGFDCPAANHTAAGDVLTLRHAHHALRGIAARQARPRELRKKRQHEHEWVFRMVRNDVGGFRLGTRLCIGCGAVKPSMWVTDPTDEATS